MVTTHEELGDVVAQCYNVTPQVHDEFIAFGIDRDNYKMEVILSFIESTVSRNPERQSIHIDVWFCHKNGERFDLSHMPYDYLLKVCNVMQGEINWGILSVVKSDTREVGVRLRRAIDLLPRDLALAANSDYESELLRALSNLDIEFGDVLTEFAEIAEQRIKTIDEVELLIGTPQGRA